jgi:spore coat polysaccharide biosynthesis protein SpsF
MLVNKPIRNENPMKYLLTIEARMRSSRLPGKVLLPILGKPMLGLMIERLKFTRAIDGIVVATTVNDSDDPIVKLAEELDVGCFRGSEEDVLQRVLHAAQQFDADVIVETTGDCPLNDPAIVDKVVSDYKIGGADFVSNTLDYTTPIGTDVRVFSTESLAEIDRISQDPADREHVSLHYWEHPEKYRLRNVSTGLPSWVKDLRLTVDTPEDFELITKIFEELYPVNPVFSLWDIVELFERKPELRKINEEIQQKAVR